jgi:hypothetical protein
MVLEEDVLSVYRLFQNNIPLSSQDTSVFIGKNSQIRPRKSEQDQRIKMTLPKYNNYSKFLSMQYCSL